MRVKYSNLEGKASNIEFDSKAVKRFACFLADMLGEDDVVLEEENEDGISVCKIRLDKSY